MGEKGRYMKPRMAYVGNRKKKEKDKKDANEAQDPRKELLQTAGFHMDQIINGGSIIIIVEKKERKKRCKKRVSL